MLKQTTSVGQKWVPRQGAEPNGCTYIPTAMDSPFSIPQYLKAFTERKKTEENQPE